MAVPDDLRRLSQMDSIFLGWIVISSTGFLTSWHKGRVQQAADGAWIFRSLSQDGSVIGYQLGFPANTWTSDEQPSTGITITIPIVQSIFVPVQPPIPPIELSLGRVILQQQLPQELTN
jgi:hypothetical protein